MTITTHHRRRTGLAKLAFHCTALFSKVEWNSVKKSKVHYELLTNVFPSTATATCLFTWLESLAWSQQGFRQPSFCRKHSLWSLGYDGRTMVRFLCITCMEKKKSGGKSICHPKKLLYTFPFVQERNAEKHHPIFQIKINHSFFRNWAVRNSSRAGLDSLA